MSIKQPLPLPVLALPRTPTVHTSPPGRLTTYLAAPAAHCTRCPLHRGCTTPGVPAERIPSATNYTDGVGDPLMGSPAVAVIGMNPGFHEDRQGRPFIGPSGAIIRGVYEPSDNPHNPTNPSAYFDLGDSTSLRSIASIYLINAFRCEHSATMANPNNMVIDACAPYLHHDLLQIASVHGDTRTYILCLGGVALKAVQRLCGIRGSRHETTLKNWFTQAQGRPLPIPSKLHINDKPPLPPSPNSVKLPTYATFHPAYYLRQRDAIRAISAHILLLRNAIRGVMLPPSDPTIAPHPRSPRKSSTPA